MAEHDRVPLAVRQEVYARDGGCCRVCGRFADVPGLHHILYRSSGVINTPENLVTIGWTPGHECHLSVVHRNKTLWLPILQQVAITPGVNGLALFRWYEAKERSYAR